MGRARPRLAGAHAPLRQAGAPDPSQEHLIYQTLVGAWPIGPRRMLEYLGKALREEKTNTGWVETDAEYERRVAAFCRGLYASRAFSGELDRVAAPVALRAQRAALGQVLLKVASPGVPDVYQGDELVDLSLVDPDNRRPVDWALLPPAEVRAGAPPDGELAKPALLHRGLALRARRPDDLGPGAPYRPLAATSDVVAFTRGAGVLAAVALRARAEDAEVEVPPDLRGRWRHVVTDARVTLGFREPVSALCAGFPVALLEAGRARTGGLRRTQRRRSSLSGLRRPSSGVPGCTEVSRGAPGGAQSHRRHAP